MFFFFYFLLKETIKRTKKEKNSLLILTLRNSRFLTNFNSKRPTALLWIPWNSGIVLLQEVPTVGTKVYLLGNTRYLHYQHFPILSRYLLTWISYLPTMFHIYTHKYILTWTSHFPTMFHTYEYSIPRYLRFRMEG